MYGTHCSEFRILCKQAAQQGISRVARAMVREVVQFFNSPCRTAPFKMQNFRVPAKRRLVSTAVIKNDLTGAHKVGKFSALLIGGRLFFEN